MLTASVSFLNGIYDGIPVANDSGAFLGGTDHFVASDIICLANLSNLDCLSCTSVKFGLNKE